MMNEEDMKMLEEYVADLEPWEDGNNARRANFNASHTCILPHHLWGCHTGHSGHRFLIMYHGTTMENALRIQEGGFIQSPDGMLGRGVYVSRSFEKAQRYPLNAGGEHLAVLKLIVRVGRVKRIDYQGHPLQKTWHFYGYDTAWVPPMCGMTPSGLEENCVYDPECLWVQEIIPNRR